jgi:hypothetical protein
MPLAVYIRLCHFRWQQKGHDMLREIMFWILFTVSLLAIGCSKLTTENYDKLRIGMNHDEVVSLFGKAEKCNGAIGIKNCMWGNEQKHVKVSFAGDKVVVFSGNGL